MRTIKAAFGLAVCCGVFAVGALAQDATASDHQAMPQHDHAAMLMQGGVAQNDINGLMDKLNRNLAAIGAEKKAGARRELLTAQGAMLKELQGKLQAQGGGMSMGMGKGMMGMGKDMDCCKGMMGNMATGDMKGMNCGPMDMNKDPAPKK